MCETQAQANERERFWIKVLDCKVPKGYNQRDGGGGGNRKPRAYDMSGMEKSGIGKMLRVRSMFARRLKELRFQNEITKAQFAQTMGVAQQTVGSWEKENSTPCHEILKKIADYFNVTTDYLLGRDTQSAPPLSLKQ